MNKRARNRLIGVTAIILIAVAAIFFGASSGSGGAAYSKTVSQATTDEGLVGQRIRLSGSVVAGSWNKKSNPMVFDIVDEGKTEGKSIKITYNKTAPATFGDGVTAIVTGVLKEDMSMEAEDMLTKCPSRYESGASAQTVDGLLLKKANAIGKPVKVTGYVKAGSLQPAGSSPRFVITQDKTGGQEIPVVFEAATPDGFADGVSVVLGGEIAEDGTFTATSVALKK